MPASFSSTRAVSRQPSAAAGGEEEVDQQVAGPSNHRVDEEHPQADAAPRAKPGVSCYSLRRSTPKFVNR